MFLREDEEGRRIAPHLECGWSMLDIGAGTGFMARWLHREHPGEPVTVCAVGPRTSTVALVAAALEAQAITCLELHGSFPSLKTVIQQNRSFEEMPELFCFGLLEAFDLERLKVLAAPRPVVEAE